MRAAVIALALVATACAHNLFDPAYSDWTSVSGSKFTYAGSPIVVSYRWRCPSPEFRGYSKTDPTACARVLDDLRVKCLRGPCEIEKGEPTGGLGHGFVKITILPPQPGDLLISSDIYKDGAHIAWAEELLHVMPRPQMQYTCDVRDPSTGDFAPCPDVIKPGTEVQMTFAVRFAPGTEWENIHMTWLDSTKEPKDGRRCALAKRPGGLRIATCSIFPTYSIGMEWKFGNITETHQLRVESPPGG